MTTQTASATTLSPDSEDTRPRPLSDPEAFASLLDALQRRRRQAAPALVPDDLECPASVLSQLLYAELPDHQETLAKLLRYNTALGVLLSNLTSAYPALVKKRILDGTANYLVCPAGWSSFRWERWEMQPEP